MNNPNPMPRETYFLCQKCNPRKDTNPKPKKRIAKKRPAKKPRPLSKLTQEELQQIADEAALLSERKRTFFNPK